MSSEKESITNQMYNGVGEVFADYLKRFKDFSENNEDTSASTINALSKLLSW